MLTTLIYNMRSSHFCHTKYRYGLTVLSGCLISCALALSPMQNSYANSDLPILSDASSSMISLEEEHELGQLWARRFRGSVPLLDDAITYSYLNDLLWEIAYHSQLQDKRLELLVVDNPVLNAFAVPGGVVGINAGILLTAEYEDELASVIAHELAHLSQRHFAAQLEEQRRNRPLSLATMLGSILLASVNSQVGNAALTASMASEQSQKLAFSRQSEQEADRMGMQTMLAAGIDPYAMPRMFQHLESQTRFQSSQIPEFLLTHPLSQSRIADSLNRAAQYSKQPPKRDNLDYLIVRLRAQVHYAKNPQTAYNKFKTLHKNDKNNKNAQNLYASALAAARLNHFKEALSLFDKLPKTWQSHLYVQLSRVQIELKAEQWQTALKRITNLQALHPDHYAVEFLLGEAYMWSEQYPKAIEIFKNLIKHHPHDSAAWYMISEAYGKDGQLAATHRSRIEFFLLTGRIDSALKQIKFARRVSSNSDYDIARLDQLEKDTKDLREKIKERF